MMTAVAKRPRALLATSLLVVCGATGSAFAQAPSSDDVAARKERRERYTRLADAGDKGDFAAACLGFAQLDVEEPNETFLTAALKACVLARDSERVADLVRRAARATGTPEREEAVREASQVLAREGGFIVPRCSAPCRADVDGRAAAVGAPYWVAAGATRVGFDAGGRTSSRMVDVPAGATVEVDAPAPPAPPAPRVIPEHAAQPPPDETAPGLSPAFFFVGAGITTALAIGTLASALDTKSRHDTYASTGTGAPDGEASQLRTNALFFTTLGVGLATGGIGIFATRWSDGAEPDGAVARFTLSH